MQRPPNPYSQFQPQQQWQQPPMPQQQWKPQQPSYPPQQYQQPPQYQPPMLPPKKKTRKPMTLGGKIGIGAGLLLLVLLIIVVAAAIDGNNNVNTANSQAAQAAQDVTGIAKDNQSIATVAVTQTALAVKKNQLLTQIAQASTPTKAPTTNLAVTHGTPHIGGLISDFYGKYGQPNNQGIGNSETWIADQQQQTLVNATQNTSGEVTGVNVTSGSNWSDTQAKTYCTQFLPSDASEFNSVSNLTDYHSSIGEIVLQLEPASCVITIAGQ